MNITFELRNHGFELREQACPPELLASLQREFAPDAPDDCALLEHSAAVSAAATSGYFQQLAASVLGEGCVPVEASLENRRTDAEPWHQEVASPTANDRMLAVRLSLDDCTFFDGALKLCPSSYKHGVLTANEVRGHSLRPFSSPEMKAGDILLMHPLTIHANAASTTGKPRRVIHILYAAY